MNEFPDLKKWYNYRPEQIMSFVYWLKRQIPPSDKKKWEKNWNDLKKQLKTKYPPPSSYKEGLSETPKGLSYDDGYKNGHADRLVGRVSKVALSSEHKWYAKGYSDGVNNRPKKSPPKSVQQDGMDNKAAGYMESDNAALPTVRKKLGEDDIMYDGVKIIKSTDLFNELFKDWHKVTHRDEVRVLKMWLGKHNASYYAAPGLPLRQLIRNAVEKAKKEGKRIVVIDDLN